MKTQCIASIILVCAVSVWAQGQVVVQGTLSLTQADDTSALIVPLFLTTAPPALGLAAGNIDRLTDASFAPTPAPMPFVGPTNPSFFQTSPLSVQTVPEPSLLAFGGLAFGVIGIMRLARRE